MAPTTPASRCLRLARRVATAAVTAALAAAPLLAAPPMPVGPGYDPDRKEIEAVLEDLAAWLPGEWSSEPQLHYERTVRMPKEGEHELWYRTFARIDAPQIGPYVFYGQINIAGRDGPLYGRSQVIYKASIDEARGVVLVRGQAIADAEKFINLQDRPELWPKVKIDEDAINCDFIWRRHGEQVIGVLEGRTADKRVNGPGTCTFMSSTGKEFYSDAEWVLSPDTLWLYDINTLGGVRFNGREDRTHTRLSRARPYRCSVRDADGQRSVDSYDRGGSGAVKTRDGQSLQWKLLRALYPAADGTGLDDQLRLTLQPPESDEVLETRRAAPTADRVALDARGVQVACARQDKFGPLPTG
jgi:hypothetical protein